MRGWVAEEGSINALDVRNVTEHLLFALVYRPVFYALIFTHHIPHSLLSSTTTTFEKDYLLKRSPFEKEEEVEKMASLSSAWQIRPSAAKSWRDVAALDNLYLNDEVPKPSSIPEKSALVCMNLLYSTTFSSQLLSHYFFLFGKHLYLPIPCSACTVRRRKLLMKPHRFESGQRPSTRAM